MIERDIDAVPTAKMLYGADLASGEPNVFIGGPPCQPFSKAGFWASGDAARFNDPRSSTLGHYLRVLEEARPRSFLFENVEGLGFRGKDEGLRLIHDGRTGINERTDASYSASVAVLNTALQQQLRRRLSSSMPATLPPPSHADPGEVALSGVGICWTTVWE